MQPNIFSFMSAMARQHNAINLAQGFPDFEIARPLIDLVHEAMLEGHNQYAPMAGLPELREAIAKKVDNLYQNRLHIEDEITITPGATYAIYTAIQTLAKPGDEVIVLEPAYDSYIPNIEAAGAKAICVPLRLPDFSVDWQKVKDAITTKTKVIIINTPHNPTGYMWTDDDMMQLENIIQNTHITIISDEVYEHICLDGNTHKSVLSYPNLWQRSFVIFSFGKTFHATGWKMGYCIAPKPLMDAFRKLHQFLCFSTNTPMQMGMAQFLTKHENEYQTLPNFFEQKRNLFLDLLKPLPFTIHQKTQGTYFQLASYEQINDKSDRDFATWLTQKIGVAVIPVSAFYANGKDDKLVRFCFGKKEETLIQAADRLQKLLG